MRTALINGVGITGIKVHSQDEQINVAAANDQVQNAAINGDRYIGIVNGLDMQEISDGRSTMLIDQYTRALASLDNIRVSAYGIPNGGVYEKAEHMLQDEQDLASGRNSLVFEDALAYREWGAAIINSIWDLDVWVEDKCSTLTALATDAFAAEQQPVPQSNNNKEAENNDKQEQ